MKLNMKDFKLDRAFKLPQKNQNRTRLWSGKTTDARHYVDTLEQTFIILRLLPWHVNVGKRWVKTPKIFRDSRIFHSPQGFARNKQLLVHPKLGASWEGFALEQILHTRAMHQSLSGRAGV